MKNAVDLNHLPVSCEEHTFEGWTVKSKKSHILSSKCAADGACVKNTADECQFCRFVNLESQHN